MSTELLKRSSHAALVRGQGRCECVRARRILAFPAGVAMGLYAAAAAVGAAPEPEPEPGAADERAVSTRGHGHGIHHGA